MKGIKFFYYSLESLGDAPPLEDLLSRLERIPLGDRLYTCSYQDIRLEEIVKPSERKPYFILRFSRLRSEDWPGVATPDSPATDLELDEDSLLSDESSMLYFPEKKEVIIQRNRLGVSAKRMQEYLHQSLSGQLGGYMFTPTLNRDALDKYSRKQLVTSVNVQINDITETDIAYFNGSGIEEAIKKSIDASANRFSIAISVDARKRDNHMDKSIINKLIKLVLPRAEDSGKLQIRAKQDADDAAELIDLLESRKFVEYDSENLPRTSGRRIAPLGIYNLLDLAFRDR